MLSLLTLMGAELPYNFVHSIHLVESSGKYGAIKGAHGELGPLQITRRCWKDSKIKGQFNDVTNYNYSVRVLNAYLNRYGTEAVANKDFKYLARLWNGGIKGNDRKVTLPYWECVRANLKNK